MRGNACPNVKDGEGVAPVSEIERWVTGLALPCKLSYASSSKSGGSSLGCTMGSHMSQGLVAEIRYALNLVQDRGIDAETLGIVREIALRRLAELEAEIAEFPAPSAPASL